MDWETLFERVEHEPTVEEIREALANRREQ
ncbi:MAG: hypothetical protein J07HX64_01663 [halophilic archaeon J07HX64]|nr:MAG: hypothetical protein J07HX64_01663 [halophilic archaeon J07HX64]